MKTKNISSYLMAGVFILFLLVGSGCKKEPEEKPSIPPESSFVMDFSGFSDASDTVTKKSKGTDSVVVKYNHWGTAFIKVAIWNVVIAVQAAVPVAAFKESFNHEAVWNKKDKLWEWTYTYAHSSGNYDAKLTGEVVGETVNWSMYISKTSGLGTFSNFLWYTGTSRFDNTSGSWTLNDRATDNPYIQIDWHKNADGTSDIKYTNVVPNGNENGGYIKYGLVNDTAYDAFYTIYNKGLNNLVNIEWHRTKHDGRIKDPLAFGNSEWHLWNTLLQNQ